MEVPMLGASAAKARQQLPEPEENAIIEAETAFIVFRTLGGEVGVTTDLDEAFVSDRQAHPHDIIGMSEVARDRSPGWHLPSDGDFNVSTAFLVYRLPGGEVLANTDLDAPVSPERRAHYPDDIAGMLAAVVRDVDCISHAPYLAQAVVQGQMQVGQAMRQQMEHAQIQQKLSGA